MANELGRHQAIRILQRRPTPTSWLPLLYDTLTQMDNDGTVVPWLADTWVVESEYRMDFLTTAGRAVIPTVKCSMPRL